MVLDLESEFDMISHKLLVKVTFRRLI